eukprot:7862230-Heterocapsa_arctica.AAC.1
MLRASQWKPAWVMNCQTNPSLARSQMKLSIWASVINGAIPIEGRAQVVELHRLVPAGRGRGRQAAQPRQGLEDAYACLQAPQGLEESYPSLQARHPEALLILLAVVEELRPEEL